VRIGRQIRFPEGKICFAVTGGLRTCRAVSSANSRMAEYWPGPGSYRGAGAGCFFFFRRSEAPRRMRAWHVGRPRLNVSSARSISGGRCGFGISPPMRLRKSCVDLRNCFAKAGYGPSCRGAVLQRRIVVNPERLQFSNGLLQSASGTVIGLGLDSEYLFFVAGRAGWYWPFTESALMRDESGTDRRAVPGSRRG